MVPAHGTVVYRVSTKNWLHAQPLVSAGLTLGESTPGIPAKITPVGQAFEATVTATNHAVVPVINPRVRLTVPSGWRVEGVSRQQKWVLRTGESVSGRWRIWPAETGKPELISSVDFGDVSITGTTELIVPPEIPRGTSALGDVRSAWESGGYGPVERDMSNGGWQPGDGKPLTINGNVYTKGMGAHAPTQMVYYLGGKCLAVASIVGIDDDRNDANKVGSASFEIWADGTKVADSGIRTWQDDPTSISAALTGATYMRLVVTDGGDTYSYDRGDWANLTGMARGARNPPAWPSFSAERTGCSHCPRRTVGAAVQGYSEGSQPHGRVRRQVVALKWSAGQDDRFVPGQRHRFGRQVHHAREPWVTAERDHIGQ